MRRHLVASSMFAILFLAGGAARAQDLINLDVRYGLGFSLYNRLNDSPLAPHYAHLEASYLFIEVGPIQMGPALAYRMGFNQREVQHRNDDGQLEDVGTTDLQHGLRPGWAVYGRPNVHMSWSAYGGVALVVAQPDVSGQAADEAERDPYFVWGLEAGGTASFFFTAGFAVTLGAQYTFFYGIDPVHVISLDLGLRFSFEVL